MSTTEETLDYAEIADLIGVSVDTVRTYQKRAEANRRAGAPSVRDLPAPVRRVGQSPLYSAEEIGAWIRTRENRNLDQGAKS